MENKYSHLIKFDKTAFVIQTLEEADDHVTYWLSKSYEERIMGMMILNSIAYGYDMNNLPIMDKNIFKIKVR